MYIIFFSPKKLEKILVHSLCGYHFEPKRKYSFGPFWYIFWGFWECSAVVVAQRALKMEKVQSKKSFLKSFLFGIVGMIFYDRRNDDISWNDEKFLKIPWEKP